MKRDEALLLGSEMLRAYPSIGCFAYLKQMHDTIETNPNHRNSDPGTLQANDSLILKFSGSGKMKPSESTSVYKRTLSA